MISPAILFKWSLGSQSRVCNDAIYVTVCENAAICSQGTPNLEVHDVIMHASRITGWGQERVRYMGLQKKTRGRFNAHAYLGLCTGDPHGRELIAVTWENNGENLGWRIFIPHEQYMHRFKDSESLQADNIWHRQAGCRDYDTVFVISLLFSLLFLSTSSASFVDIRSTISLYIVLY